VTWINERLTSMLYGGAMGAILTAHSGPFSAHTVGSVLVGIAAVTEMYRRYYLTDGGDTDE
jgi:hypothetical protein